MRFVFWQNIVSQHQSAHLTALARLGHQVILVAENESMPSRLRMGWAVPEMAGVEIVLAPSEPDISDLLRANCSESVHIFSGARGFAMVEHAFNLSKKHPVRRGLLVENRPRKGVKGVMRRVLYRVDGIRNRGFVDFLLVIGFCGKHGGKRYFRQSGYPERKLYPYGYFVDGFNQVESSRPDSTFRMAFVGSLDLRKRCDLLVGSLALLPDMEWRLDVIGDGPERANLRRLAESARLQDRIAFQGYHLAERVPGLIAGSDLFVLPSNHDGWGVVVNEALIQGVPVVCSDRCGASDLLGESWRGEMFPAGSVKELARILERRIFKGPPTEAERKRIRDWTARISGESAAKYLLSIVEYIACGGIRPTAPWRADSGKQ